jgi:7,8-dihydro-6-hydroxymethylpterin-pyrophosphokinase
MRSKSVQNAGDLLSEVCQPCRRKKCSSRHLQSEITESEEPTYLNSNVKLRTAMLYFLLAQLTATINATSTVSEFATDTKGHSDFHNLTL